MSSHAASKASPAPLPRFTFSPEVSEFNVPMTDFAAGQSGIDLIASSSLVFHGPRVLLVQRAAHDSFPGKWEAPGGAVDAEDETVLHGVARELWEEAGLVAARVGHVVARRQFVLGRGASVALYTFEVEVAVDGNRGDGPPPVVLDPNEHQDYLWATEEECRAGVCGDVRFEMTLPNVKQTILDGFSRRQEERGSL